MKHLPRFMWVIIALMIALAGCEGSIQLEEKVQEHDAAIATHAAIFTQQASTATLEPTYPPFPTSTVTAAPTNTPVATSNLPPTPTQEVPDNEISCAVKTVSTVPLTLRESPGSNSTSKGQVQPGTVITIYPYDSTIYPPSQSTDYAWWYVRVADTDNDPFNDLYIAYAKTIAPRLTPPGVTPAIIESHFAQVDGGSCYPSVYGLSPAPESTPVPTIIPATAAPIATRTPTQAPVVALSPFTTQGNLVYLNGQPFKYVGVNFRELIGYGDIMPYASQADLVTQLDGAKSLGMRVVRFYASHKSLTVDQAIPRVRNILNMLQERALYGIVVLTDGAYSGFEIKDNSTNRAVNGIDRYTHAFFEGGYRQNYLPYVDALTKAIGDHPAIFAYEIGNEFTTVNLSPTKAQRDAFLSFYSEASAVIRHNAPKKLISSGLESCWQLFVTHAYEGDRDCEKLYQIVDIGTLHTYQSSNGNVLGSSYMHILREMEIANQPLIIEEVSTFWENETADWLDVLVKASFNRLTGIMQWGMSFPYGKDIGVGDGAWNAPAGTPQARRWYYLTGFYRALADQLRLMY